MAEGFTLADLEKDVVVPDVEPTITTLGPTTEPTSEVPELTPEVPVSEQPVIEVPTEEEPESSGFTLGDLYPQTDVSEAPLQQTQDLTSPFTLKGAYSGFDHLLFFNFIPRIPDGNLKLLPKNTLFQYNSLPSGEKAA